MCRALAAGAGGRGVTVVVGHSSSFLLFVLSGHCGEIIDLLLIEESARFDFAFVLTLLHVLREIGGTNPRERHADDEITFTSL